MKTFHPDKRLSPIIIGSLFLLASAIFLYFAGAYNFCYLEQWQTFIYDPSYICQTGMKPGGTAELIALFLIQFFKFPITGILITSLLLSIIFMLSIQVFRRWTGSGCQLLPATLLPVISLAFLHFNTNYLYSGTVAFVFMMMGLSVQIRIRKFHYRYIFSLFSSILLFFLAGPIAMLYTILLLIMEVSRSPKKATAYLFLPLLVLLMAHYCLRMGWAGEWKHLIGPAGYFTLRLPAGSAVWLPWGMTIGTFVFAALYQRFKPQKTGAIRFSVWTQALITGTFLFMGGSQYISKDNELFKELNYLARYERWNDIIGRSDRIPKSNLLLLNYLNLALAEQGKLLGSNTIHPGWGTQCLFISGNKTPYISAMLSDIYFSMGHISFAQRYAFEANESSGNFSPKLLQRLAQTSLIYGNKELALKYIQLLEKTLFYKDWSQGMKAQLENPNLQDTKLTEKKKCIFPDNRFAGSKGLDDDLQQIIRQNPSHLSAQQYLGAIQTLTGMIIQER